MTPFCLSLVYGISLATESQKMIIIGKGGSKLRELGITARLALEEFLDRKVFLTLQVKIDEDWRASTEALKRYGYIESDFA